MKSKVLNFIVFSFITKVLYAQTEEVCMTRRNYDSLPSSTEVRQGRPGKIGPKGPPGVMGQQGEPGPPGTCVCDEELVDIRNELQIAQVSSCGVGLKDRTVLDSFMTASSNWDSTWSARNGRLDNSNYCWIAGQQEQRIGEWIQVDLQAPVRVVAVVTQGRSNTNQYVTSFKIQYGNNTENLETIENNNGIDTIFQGNTDTTSYKVNEFSQPITAQYFRLVVQSWNAYISMRLEYFNC